MQDWDALKYFLTNLGLHNLVLVLLAAGVGVLLGRVLFARSAQGLIQLRKRMSGEVERAEKAEAELEKQVASYAQLREQIDSGEGGMVVVNSPELEKELEVLRARATEADATLERMIEANAALEEVVKSLEVQQEEKGEEETGELMALTAEAEELRKKSEDLQGERAAEMAELRGALEVVEEKKKSRKAKAGNDVAVKERIAALEMQLLDARGECKQVEEASAILRKELYGMRHDLEEVEKREHLEKELIEARLDAETRLQAQVAAGTRKKKVVEIPPVKAPPEDEEVVRLSVDDEPEEREEASAKGIPVVVEEDEQVCVVEEVMEAEPEEVVEVPAVESPMGPEEDELTRLRGVGAILAKRLHRAGVTSFRQIAEWSEEEVRTMSEKLSLQNRVKQGDWQAQARALHQEVHGEEL